MDRHIVPCDQATAQIYGEIKAGLRKKGRPLPDNDIWIAAQAIQHSGIIVSRDRHFREVEGLQVEALA
jgi:tRNA(fMet)-specific endonuclease VapC